MARCDQGYLCEVCGNAADVITESDLYLRFVIGEITPSQLPGMPERHIRCNPVLAQFIDHPNFPPVTVQGDFDKRLFDADDVSSRTTLVTRGWLRLQELSTSKDGVPLSLYPLPEFRRAAR